YILFRDSLLQGKSVGKFLFGLMVIRLSDGKPCSISRSILRNLIFIIPGMNIVAFIFEAYFSIKDKQGIRLGDKFAITQVVEGKKVPELVKLFQIILSYFNKLAEEEFPQKELGSR
ncbi:MAG: RDD family protein, partial [Nitrososphaera sp.]